MLIDSTLREGAQAYGVSFGTGARRRVAELLCAAGVDEMECGWVGMEGLEDFLAWAAESLPASCPGGSAPALSLWSPCREGDVREAARLLRIIEAAGLESRLNIGAPSSALHREKRLGLSRAEMAARVRAVVAAARSHGFGYVSVGLEDISRADADEALSLAHAAVSAGAARVRLADTVGLLTPSATAALVGGFAASLPVPVALHAHNDLGLATANAVTALEHGASFVDASALGLGERAGIAALEQVAAWANQHRGADYDLSVLRALCLLAGQSAKVPVARNRPVVGEDIFAAESGIHVHGLLRDPALFEPFAPESVGASRRVGVGAKSGCAALAQALARLRQPAAACDAGLMSRVRALAERLGRPLTDSEILGVL